MNRICLDTPNEQNARGDFFSVGNPDGEVIFLMGSCRIIPYLNYLHQYNQIHNRFKIYCFLPYVFKPEQLTELESNETLLNIFRATKIFIYEHHAHFGLFNTGGEKTIYQFGMEPELKINIPSWNDCFVLWDDIMSWDSEIKELAKTTGPEDYSGEVFKKSLYGYDKFYSNCEKTDFPEFADWFRSNFRKKRLFWNFNHITKDFSLKVFEMLNDKFLHLELSEEFWKEAAIHDHLEGNFTPVTEWDIKLYNYAWK